MSTDELTRFATYEDEPKRPKLGLIAGLTALVVFGVIVLIVLSQRDRPALAELRIRAKQVEVEKSGTRGRAGVEGEPLAAGDTVRTDANGQAQIDYFTGTITRLDVNTTMVVDGLLNAAAGKRISLKLNAGRTWNRVEGITSSQDRFDVQMPNALASVRGTTNVTDCRQAPSICYVLGFLDNTEILTNAGEQVTAGPGDCFRIDEVGMRPCTDHEKLRLLDDTWLDEMGGLDALAAFKTPPPTVSPPASVTPGSGGFTRRSSVTPSPKPRVTRSPRPRNTDDPDETEEPTDEPTEEPSAEPSAAPTPESPSPPPEPVAVQ
jgi:hypothetical protein